MKLFVFVALVGFLAIQNVESAPKVSPQQESTIQETVVSKTQEILKNADDVLAGKLPDSKQIISKIESTGNELVASLKSFNDLIKKNLNENKGSVDSTLKEISENFKENRKILEEKILGPDGQKKAEEIREAVQKSIKDAASQIGKLGDTLKPEAEKVKNDILAGAKIFLDNAEKFTNDLKAPKH